ncbi:MAG: DUF3572 domain-containing protein [Paracoccaceae bacterium]
MNEQNSAETLALRAVVWLLEDNDRAQAFMAATGAGPSDLAASAESPAFLAAVLDFVLTDDDLVKAFCDTQGLPYPALMQARAHLPGFSQVHWT